MFDAHDAKAIKHIVDTFPHLSPVLQRQLAKFDAEVARNGADSIRNAPIVPARISARHPLAY